MILLIGVFGLYFFGVICLTLGWRIAMKPNGTITRPSKNFRITVVVPFRNEESNVENLVEDLIRQNYDFEFMEVLLSNDHSTDDSVRRAHRAIASHANFRIINSPGQGKKHALAHAIEHSIGEIIVTTDADVSIPPNWLLNINNAFQDPRVKMVIGVVKISEDKTFFSKLQTMEFASLIGSGAATLSLGLPTMCNGANLAFLKSAFLGVGGYEGNLNIPSGDDEFLMRKINRHFPGSITFLNAQDAVVFVEPSKTVEAFINQRLRWSGKWTHNSRGTIMLAIFVLLFQLSFLAIVTIGFLGHFLPVVLFLVAIKLLLEIIFLIRIYSFLQIKWNWLSFLTLQFVYPVYVIFIGVSANFMSYRWKGRNVNV